MKLFALMALVLSMSVNATEVPGTIFYKLKDTGSRGWSDSDVREWCDKNDVYYESTDKRTDLIEKIKKAGFR